MSAFVKDKNFYRQFFVLSLTIALQNVIVYSVNLADNIMLGKFAEDAMAGVALVNQVQFFLQSMIMGLAEASLMFASRSWGEKDIPSIRKMANISCTFCYSFLYPGYIAWTSLKRCGRGGRGRRIHEYNLLYLPDVCGNSAAYIRAQKRRNRAHRPCYLYRYSYRKRMP